MGKWMQAAAICLAALLLLGAMTCRPSQAIARRCASVGSGSGDGQPYANGDDLCLARAVL